MLTTIAFGALGLGLVAATVMTVWSRHVAQKSEDLARARETSSQRRS